jgi:membrane protease YdiL (CAAX protease family)
VVNGERGGEESNGWNPWYGPLALLIGFVASIISGVVVVVIGHAAGSSLTNPTPAVTDVGTLVEEIGFVLSALWVASWTGWPRPAQFGVRRPPRFRLWQIALAVALAYVAFIVLSALWTVVVSQGSSEKYLVKDVGAHAGAAGVLAACLVLCVVAPVCEEFLFRGFIFGAIRNWRGPWLAAVITGVLFGAIHVGSAPVVDLVPLAVFGILLCGLRQLTGSLYPGIALHSLNNAAALVVNADWSFTAFLAVFIGSLALIAALVSLSQDRLKVALW